MDGITLLVGRVYGCSLGHEVVGYHPGIVAQIPICFVPFQLWYITGFTVEFISMTVALITAGMSIGDIRNHLHKTQVALYYNRQQQYKVITSSDSDVHGVFPNLDTWKNCFASFLPSAHALSGCFLADFWTKERVYTQCMQNTTTGDNDDAWLSLDHTFSSASEFSMEHKYLYI